MDKKLKKIHIIYPNGIEVKEEVLDAWIEQEEMVIKDPRRLSGDAFDLTALLEPEELKSLEEQEKRASHQRSLSPAEIEEEWHKAHGRVKGDPEPKKPENHKPFVTGLRGDDAWVNSREANSED